MMLYPPLIIIYLYGIKHFVERYSLIFLNSPFIIPFHRDNTFPSINSGWSISINLLLFENLGNVHLPMLTICKLLATETVDHFAIDFFQVKVMMLLQLLRIFVPLISFFVPSIRYPPLTCFDNNWRFLWYQHFIEFYAFDFSELEKAILFHRLIMVQLASLNLLIFKKKLVPLHFPMLTIW